MRALNAREKAPSRLARGGPTCYNGEANSLPGNARGRRFF